MKSRDLTTTAAAAAAAAVAATGWAENLGAGDQGQPGRQTCWAVWREDLAAFEVLQPRGDSLRSMGETWRGRTMLHAEEGLWLVERGMLAVYPFSNSSASRAPAATPSAAAATEDENGGDVEADPRGSRPEAVVEKMGEHHQGGEKNEGNTVHEHVGTSRGYSKGGQRKEEEKEVMVGQGRATCSEGLSTIKNHPSASTAAGEPGPSMAASLSKCSFSGKVPAAAAAAAAGKSAGNALRSREPGGRRPAPMEERGHDPRKRVGGVRKRGRSGSTESEKRDGGGFIPAPFMSAEDLHGSILPRAGVPWECYRAYAELKRRSYVVRRQPEDTVGHDDATPRAAALSWFKPSPAPAAAATARSLDSFSREADTDTGTGTDSNNVTATTSILSPSSASPSAGPLPSPSPLPVTFHVYNNGSGSSSSSSSSPFRKRNPGPPDALLAVCRFEDPMPEHGSLVALAERHAHMVEKDASASASSGSASKPEQWWRREGRTGSVGKGVDLESKERVVLSGRGDGTREKTAAAAGGDRRRRRGGDTPSGTEEAEYQERGKGCGLSGQRRGEWAGEVESARNLGRCADDGGVGDGRRGRESGIGVLSPGSGTPGAGGERLSLDRQHDGLVVSQPRAEEVLSLRQGGEDAGGGRERHNAGEGGGRTGLLLAAAAQRAPPPGLVKLAVVSWEAGVQLFDVGLHDANEAAEPLPAN
eukprot:g4999.t1